MAYEKLKLETQGAIQIITLSDPATMNAASVEMADELTSAFRHANADPAVRAIVLTGEGRGFCSGANLSPGGGGAAGGVRDAGSSLEKVYNPLVTFAREMATPLVTAVNGAAAGVGCSLALLGDLIVAAEGAYFLQAFRRIGLVPDGGSTYLLPRMIGRARAMEMAMLGERVPAPQALQWGLINRCVPDAELMPTAMALAEALASGPASLGLTRQLIWGSLDTGWSEQLHKEAVAQNTAGRTEDFGEGVAAFLQKRKAEFKGR
ncbi:MAG TPA: enoyl-CoA hydratase/isomerase [Caulobacteraceae bacterium]|jgi:2-(1,2-epoxy-1,2-dihydrophenyl)acetyl-CoA isomerase|nr:enoyl-CoA hydratase/isomerase [Caulobacteraceae bacterium]